MSAGMGLVREVATGKNFDPNISGRYYSEAHIALPFICGEESPLTICKITACDLLDK